MKRPQMVGIRPTPEDHKLLASLSKKLGVTATQVFRLALRALATKEGVTT
jgi:hypothetical protein